MPLWTKSGDPALAAKAILTALDADESPLRLVLGADAIGTTRLQHVTPAMLNKLYGDLGEHLSAATVRYVHVITRRALADASSPMRSLATPPIARCLPSRAPPV